MDTVQPEHLENMAQVLVAGSADSDNMDLDTVDHPAKDMD